MGKTIIKAMSKTVNKTERGEYIWNDTSSPSSDLGGIQTRNQQNRNLVLYSIELRSHAIGKHKSKKKNAEKHLLRIKNAEN